MTWWRRKPARRRRFGEAMAELHRLLRTEGAEPVQTGIAVGVGCFVGCLPLYGLHLALCTVSATALGVSRVKTYLAAHVNNPVTAPFLLYTEVACGRWLLSRQWPRLSDFDPRAIELARLGRDLLLGSVVVGVVLGLLLGVGAFAASRRRGRSSRFSRRVEIAAEPYLRCGILHWELVRGKLRHDPVYRQIVESDLLPAAGRLVDLGCGRGILLSIVDTWSRRGRGGDAGGEGTLELVGVDSSAKAVRVAREALGRRARLRCADAVVAEVPPCTAAALIDVLHYLPAEGQEVVLERAGAALERGGVLFVREADAGGGVRFLVTRVAERCRALARGDLWQRFHYREVERWRTCMEEVGLEVETRPSARGTPFANHLLIGRRPTTGEGELSGAAGPAPADRC